MDINLIAVIVGIVEGLTEFVPVSSTGHMVIVGHLLGFEGNLATVFDIFVQLGAILSVVFIYKERFRRFFTKEGWTLANGFGAYHVMMGVVPVAGIAYLLHKPITTYLFSPFTVAVGLVAGSLLMVFAEKRYGVHNDELLDDLDQLSLKQAFQIGLYQVFSLWPGFSRSGSTLAGGLITGVSRECTAQYTFIIAVPLMFMATVYDLLKNWSLLSVKDFEVLGIGFFVSMVVAYVSVLWFLQFLKRSTLTAFAVYRVLLAAVTLLYFYA